jgi:hypothetical protein
LGCLGDILLETARLFLALWVAHPGQGIHKLLVGIVLIEGTHHEPPVDALPSILPLQSVEQRPAHIILELGFWFIDVFGQKG